MANRPSVALYLWPYHRQLLLERHDFYVAQVKKRVLAFMTDELVEAEVEAHGDEVYAELGAYASPDGDPSDLYERVHDEQVYRYGLLTNLRRDMTLAALATAYHLWERELREFIEHEVRRYVTDPDPIVWGNRDGVFGTLGRLDWNVESEPFYRLLEASNLLVNVHKHGKGSSFTTLLEQFPQYVPTPIKDMPFIGHMVDHNDVVISESQLDELLGALRSFWVAMPQDLVLRFPKLSPP